MNSSISYKHAVILYGDIFTECTPGSLTHWKKWYPSLFSSLKMSPFFVAKQWLFTQNDPLFAIKHWLFSPKWTPCFAVKHWFFSPNVPSVSVKYWTSKLTPFSPNSRMWVPKYPLFLGKCETRISSKNTPLFANFRMGVVK